MAPWNSPSTASMNTFEGSIIYQDWQHVFLLAIVKWERDVIFRQANVIWTIQNRHGALEEPVNCIFEDTWRIPCLLGVDIFHKSRQLSPENEMSYQGKETSRCVIWTIQSCHNASIWHPILSWKLPTCKQAKCLSPIDDGSFKYLQRCSWQAVLG